jgi:hypothetical protein
MENEVLRGGHDEVGVRKPCKGDSCEDSLGGGCIPEGEYEGEAMVVDGLLAI